MSISRLAAMLLLSCCSMLISPSVRSEAGLTETLETVVEAYHEVYGFSGTVRALSEDALVLEKSVGLAERSFGIPHGPATRVSINSISKTFTAVTALRLAERGELDLHASVASLLESFDAEWADRVTVHHLLSHSSGLPREAGLDADSERSLDEQLESVAGLSLRFEPGSEFGYSNAGYILLGNVIEAATGKDFAEVIEAEVLRPAGLEDTGMFVGRRVVERQAVPYRFGPGGIDVAQRTKTLGESAGGGLYSTPADLERFVRALEDDTLLNEASRERLFAAHIGAGEGGHEAYAWSIKNFGPRTLRFSAGSGYGTKSVVVRDPDSGLFIAIVSNWGSFPVLNLLRDLFLVIQGQEIELPDGRNLAQPSELDARLGRYRFDAEALRTALQTDDRDLVLHAFEGKVFLGDELLAVKDAGVYGLTYTDELTLRFDGDVLVVQIGGRILRGARLD